MAVGVGKSPILFSPKTIAQLHKNLACFYILRMYIASIPKPEEPFKTPPVSRKHPSPRVGVSRCRRDCFILALPLVGSFSPELWNLGALQYIYPYHTRAVSSDLSSRRTTSWKIWFRAGRVPAERLDPKNSGGRAYSRKGKRVLAGVNNTFSPAFRSLLAYGRG